MKGIILAGGSGTRLYPLTTVTSKQLLPVYDKPMIYYPLSTLMLAGIRDILIISTPEDLPSFERLLGDGSDFGVRFSYRVQPRPEGLAQAFLLGEDFIAGEPCAAEGGAYVFGYRVSDPERYGVVEFDAEDNVIGLEEKPAKPKSNWAVPGLYFYGGDVAAMAKTIRPSPRGELEITDLNLAYMRQGRLKVKTLGRGIAWLDTGTYGSLLEASNFVETIQNRQGLKIACLEEIAFRYGWLPRERLAEIGRSMAKNDYGRYLLQLAEEADAR